jgi:hypothetical protein
MCFLNTSLGQNSFYQNSDKPNKALSIFPDYDMTRSTRKQWFNYEPNQKAKVLGKLEQRFKPKQIKT